MVDWRICLIVVDMVCAITTQSKLAKFAALIAVILLLISISISK